ncbi:MAG: 3-oxoacyl-ACP reductase [Jatrophihabitans sp.]|uniref:3-oxoacyl-ACP reductase n=1 Tax=Jatrophihabitans sp. TaxID=1932789 RepID=UPI003F7FA744
MTDTLASADAVAVVTGAGAGLGRAEALALAAAGARVVVNDVSDGEAARSVVDEIEALGSKAVLVAGDVGERATADALVAAAVEHFGGLNIVVNNAGFTRDRMLFNMSDDEWDAVVRVHLRGHFLLSRNAAAYWRQQGKETGAPVYGRVVNTSSEAGLVGSEGQANYAAAKAGIAALTVATARGMARFGVTANAICPRARTAMTAGVFGEAPTDRPDPLSVDHVTPLVTWLASPASAAVSGQVFVVHGGLIALMQAPTVAARFDAPDGAWSPDAVDAQLGRFFADRDPGLTFASPDVLGLA